MGCCFGRARDDEDLNKSRQCTDKFWLFIFILSWIVLLLTAAYSLMKGDPTRILFGYDSFGNICGNKNKAINGVPWSGMDMRGKPYVFHMNPRNLSYSLKICVSKCADSVMEKDPDLKKFYRDTNSSLYRYDYDVRENYVEKYYQIIPTQDIATKRHADEQKGFGPAPIWKVAKQRPVVNRCVSTEKVLEGKHSFINKVYEYIKNVDMLEKIFSDIYISRHNIGYLVGLSIVVSIVVVFSIHFLASVVSALIMIIATLIMLALTAFSWYVYYDLTYKLNSVPVPNWLDDDIVNSRTFFALSILLTIITIIVLAITYFMKSRIDLMVALFNETAACFRSMPALAIQPIWTTAVLILFILFWSTILLAISTAENEIIYNSTTTRFQLQLPAREAVWSIKNNSERELQGFSSTANKYALESVKHRKPEAVRYIWVFLLIMLFWSTEFILGCQQMTVAASVATWYFSRDRSSLSCTIGNSIHKILSYHLGSIVLGSFLIVLFKIPRIILMYLEYQFQKVKGKYRCIECALTCCHCFWYVVEKFIKYINHNAYTIIAIEGTPYCTSAQVAFSTLAANTARVVIINSVGDFILFLGKLIVTASVALVGMYYVRFDTNIYYMAVPILFASIISYFIAHSMLSVYEMVIDTMFLCYVEDVTKNANSPEGYYAPPSLLAFAGDERVNSGALRIAAEVKARSPDSEKSRPFKSPKNNGNDNPQIGFVYPQQVLESSH